MDNTTLVLAVVPVALLDLGLKIWALLLLSRAEKVRGGSRLAWVLVVLFVNLLGAAAFLLFGREER